MQAKQQLQEWQQEAEQLAKLPLEGQLEVIALHKARATDPKTGKADREFARKRAAALEKFLRQPK